MAPTVKVGWVYEEECGTGDEDGQGGGGEGDDQGGSGEQRVDHSADALAYHGLLHVWRDDTHL